MKYFFFSFFFFLLYIGLMVIRVYFYNWSSNYFYRISNERIDNNFITPTILIRGIYGSNIFSLVFFFSTLIGHDLSDMRGNEWLVKKIFTWNVIVTFTSLKLKFHKNQYLTMATFETYELEFHMKRTR